MWRNTFSDYDHFAWLYNKYWGSFFSDNLYHVIEKLVLKRLPHRPSLLDLCCGTGQLSHALSAKGCRVTGIDGSVEMLKFAKKNSPTCRFVRADVRRFRLNESFDAVLSTFDSLNHIMNIAELEVVFENVNFALKKDGLFLFDMNTDEGFKTRWHGSFGIVGDDHTCIIRSDYNSKTKIGRYNITMFFRKKRSWSRSDLRLREKCYEIREITSALRKAGFNHIRSYDSRHDLKLREVGRIFFVCKR